MSNYWKIWAEEMFNDLGISVAPEQIERVAQSAEFARQDYGDQHGYREGDISVTRMRENQAMEKVFAFIDAQIAALDRGPNVFDRLSHTQKMALGALMHARQELASP